MKLRKLENQVIVITGASSGIGMLTALHAGARGAKVVLAARNENALRKLEEKITADGGQALAVATDVTSLDEVQRLADKTIEHFGGFDTWVNNAGISIYGREESVDLEDERQLFDVTYWGVVYGCRVAIKHLRKRGGALINMGSVASDRSLPLQASYSAAKHAVKGYTDTLRMELDYDRTPISVTLIKPGFIDTAFIRHSKRYLPVKPKYGQPIYAPELVADAVLHAAEHPVRDLVVGGGGKLAALAGMLSPRSTDKVMEYTLFEGQQSDIPDTEPDSLYTPEHFAEERSGYHHARKHSLYTAMAKHRRLSTAALLLGTGALATTFYLRHKRHNGGYLAGAQRSGETLKQMMGQSGRDMQGMLNRPRRLMQKATRWPGNHMENVVSQPANRMKWLFGRSERRMEDMLGHAGSDVHQKLGRSVKPYSRMMRRMGLG